MRKAFLFTLIGILLGLGAPVGALVLLWYLPHAPVTPSDFLVSAWREHSFFLTYMLVGTILVFGTFGFFTGRDEDRVLRRNRRLTDQVLTDPLTGLGNHRFLHESFYVEFRKHMSSHQPISCLMMDLDHFKAVNDTYGHPFGDYVLTHFARIIKQSIREVDTAARYGGEEFLCILPNCDIKEAKMVAERVRTKTENYLFVKKDSKVRITVSVGTATSYRNSKTNYKQLIGLADQALYSAKHRGRNRVVQAVLTDPKKRTLKGKTG